MNESLPVKISVDACGHGTVVVDSVDITNHVRGLVLEADVDAPTRLTLKLVNVSVETDARAVVVGGEKGKCPNPVEPVGVQTMIHG